MSPFLLIVTDISEKDCAKIISGEYTVYYDFTSLLQIKIAEKTTVL